MHKCDKSLVPVSLGGGQDVSSTDNLESCFMQTRLVCKARLVLKTSLPVWNMLGEGGISGHGSSAELAITIMLVMFTEKQIYWSTNSFQNVMYKKTDIIAPGHVVQFFRNTLFTIGF